MHFNVFYAITLTLVQTGKVIALVGFTGFVQNISGDESLVASPWCHM
jgi:hypothetical protein